MLLPSVSHQVLLIEGAVHSRPGELHGFDKVFCEDDANDGRPVRGLERANLVHHDQTPKTVANRGRDKAVNLGSVLITATLVVMVAAAVCNGTSGEGNSACGS
jgi:hypothetical protein